MSRSFQEVAALVVDNGSGLFMAGFAGSMHLTQCFPLYVGRPVMPGIMVGLESVYGGF